MLFVRDFTGQQAIRTQRHASLQEKEEAEPSVPRDLLVPPAVGLCQAWRIENIMPSVREYWFKVCRIAKTFPARPR